MPAELRNRIYNLVLLFANLIKVGSATTKTSAALLQTCFQVRAEASKIFYASNAFAITFGLEKHDRGAAWLEAIGGDAAAALSDLRIEVVPMDACGMTLNAILNDLNGHRRGNLLYFPDLNEDVKTRWLSRATHVYGDRVLRAGVHAERVGIIPRTQPLHWLTFDGNSRTNTGIIE